MNHELLVMQARKDADEESMQIALYKIFVGIARLLDLFYPYLDGFLDGCLDIISTLVL